MLLNSEIFNTFANGTNGQSPSIFAFFTPFRPSPRLDVPFTASLSLVKPTCKDGNFDVLPLSIRPFPKARKGLLYSLYIRSVRSNFPLVKVRCLCHFAAQQHNYATRPIVPFHLMCLFPKAAHVVTSIDRTTLSTYRI